MGYHMGPTLGELLPPTEGFTQPQAQFMFSLCSGALQRGVINYVSVTFQIFFLVILFAAYNGLVVLPVLLSIAGPSHQSTLKAIAKTLGWKGKNGESQGLDLGYLRLQSSKKKVVVAEGLTSGPVNSMYSPGHILVVEI